MNTNKLIGLSLLAAGCAYTAPENTNSQVEGTNTISGTILAQGIEDPGSAVVLVYDASNPGPPLGTGRPLTFTTVPSSAFTENGAGIKSAPFAIPYLADSDPAVKNAQSLDIEHSGYHVTVLVDQDHNFNPLGAVGLVGATFDDYTGAHLADIETNTRGAVMVSGGELKNDITIVVTDHITVQRPMFTPVTPPVVNVKKGSESGVDPGNAQRYRIRSVPVHTEYPKAGALDFDGPCDLTPDMDEATCETSAGCHCDPGTLDPSETAFWVMFVDADGDGVHDPYPPNPDGTPSLQALNGIKDSWPRLFLEYRGHPSVDEDGNTAFDFDGTINEYEWPPESGLFRPERWVAENFTMAYELNFLGATLIAPDGATYNTPFPVNEMSMTWSPVARHYYAEGSYSYDDKGPYDLIDVRCFDDPSGVYPDIATCDGSQHTPADIPKGAWQMTMISYTGQTWVVPNEIGNPNEAYKLGMFSKGNGFDGAMESTDPSFTVASQDVWLTTE